VKSCLQYRGTPDPLKGDAPNKSVREEADLAIKSVFSSDSTTNAYGLTTDSGKKMQGFGSDTSNELSSRIGTLSNGPASGNSFGSSGKSFGGPSNMVGFGNPNFNNAPPVEEKETVFRQAFSNTLSAVSKLAGKAQGGYGSTPSMPESSGSTYRAPAPSSVSSSDYSQGGAFGSGVKGRWGDTTSSMSGSAVHKEPGDYEARVVGEICTVGGPRVAPSQTALEEFCRKCESLDASCVGEQLKRKLANSDWQTRLRALHAVESLSQHGLDSIVGYISEHASEMLFEAQEMPQCRQKATKVLATLGFIDEQVEKPSRSTHPAAATTAPPASEVDLLDMDDNVAPAPSAQSHGLGGAQLLGGADLIEAQPLQNGMPAESQDMLGFDTPTSVMTAPCAPEQPIHYPADPTGGLFGNLSVRPQDATSAPAPYTPPEQPSLLATIESQAQQQASDSSQLFASLQVGGSTGAGASMQQPPTLSSFPSSMPLAGQPQQLMSAPSGGQPNDQADRTAHLTILSGGSQSAMPGAVQPSMQGMLGSCVPQYGGIGGAQPASMQAQMQMQMQPQNFAHMQPQLQLQMQQQMYSMQMQPQMQMPMQMQSQMQPQMMQHFAQPQGMPGSFAASSPCLGNQMMMQAAPPNPGMSAAGSSAFGFMSPATQLAQSGGLSPAPIDSYAPNGRSDQLPSSDSAFSFVADQMRGATS